MYVTIYSYSVDMVKNIFSKTDFMMPVLKIYQRHWTGLSGKLDLVLPIMFIAMQIYVDIKLYNNQSAQDTVKRLPLMVRWVLYYALFYLILLGKYSVETFFIYGGF